MNENQTTYPTGAQDEEEIDLIALMVTLLHKLKPILLTAVVCAVIAGGLAGVKILRGGAVSAVGTAAWRGIKKGSMPCVAVCACASSAVWRCSPCLPFRRKTGIAHRKKSLA